MGVKADRRSRNAQKKKAELEAQRKRKELDKRKKALEKEQKILQNASEVKKIENQLKEFLSLHIQNFQKINWAEVISSPCPPKPLKSDELAANATKIKDSYKPSIFDKLFNRVESKLELMYDKLDQAKREDSENYKNALKQWAVDCKDWEKKIKFAKKISSEDENEKIEGFLKLNNLNNVEYLGSDFNFYYENSIPNIEYVTLDKSIIPKEKKILLKNGSVSTKSLNQKDIDLLYQGYVCSSVLRVGIDTLSIIKENKIFIHAKALLLNKSTGHFINEYIVSILIDSSILEKLDLNNLDPSESMKNFQCNMNFKNAVGFNAVKKLSIY